MLNIFKVVEETLDAIAHDVKKIHFEDGHLEVKAKVSVSGKVYDATADHRRGSAGDAAYGAGWYGLPNSRSLESFRLGMLKPP